MEIDQLWQTISEKRKPWQPSDPKPNSEICKVPRTISRALSLRGLEMPVKQFLQDGLDRADSHKLGEKGIATLQRNQEDEDRHDLALERCYKAMGNYNPQVTGAAPAIIQAWLDLDCHPITKAAVLENGVFFVVLPLFNLHGTISLKETSQWISGDEILHVQSHRTASELLGEKPTKELDELRVHTVEWLVQYLDEELQANGKAAKWIRASQRLMEQGKSNLNESQFAIKPAFFELSNRTLTPYA